MSCSDMLTRFNPDDVRSQDRNDCLDTSDCDLTQDSGETENGSSTDQNTPFNGFSGYINQTFVFGQEYQNQGYSNCTMELSLQAAGAFNDNGCSGCDLLGESNANLTTSCNFAENASGTFIMGIDTNNELAYSYRDADGWQPLYESSSCNGGLNISSTASSLSVDCIYEGDGLTQETNMSIFW